MTLAIVNLETIERWCVEQHRNANHLYNKVYPYEVHLNWAVSAAKRFIHLLPNVNPAIVYGGCLAHDTIEDARASYNDVKKNCGEQVADIAYALTNEKGKNRAERANEKYYAGIRADIVFIFVKLCDRIANMEFSNIFGGKADMYRKEMPKFLKALGLDDENHQLAPMVKYLLSI